MGVLQFAEQGIATIPLARLASSSVNCGPSFPSHQLPSTWISMPSRGIRCRRTLCFGGRRRRGLFSPDSPVGDAVCCALCLCLRVHSTTRSYECGWFPNTVCAPDATQWSSLLPMSHWALYDLDDRGRVRLLLPSCMPPVCAWYGVCSLPSA